MCAEATLGEFAISLVLVISCEPVKVESESRNWKSSEFIEGNKTIIPVPVFLQQLYTDTDNYMGLGARKPVFWVSDIVRPKQVFLATETC